MGGQHHTPAALPPRKTRYPLYRRLGGPQGWSGRVRKILPQLGFDPRTVQLVASRYTHYAIPARRDYTVLSESRCALKLRYVDLVASIEARLMS
jgi:hypothetical protein